VHDVKNLSFRLSALLHNLETHYEDPLFKKSVVEVLSDTVARMDRLVRQCRDAHEGLVFRYPLDLNEILNGVVESLPRTEAGDGGITIEERYARIPRIWGDPAFLAEALAIVVRNGIESMEDRGGRLLITTLTSKTRAGKKKVEARIRDTGCGMPPDFIKDGLFSPFVTTKADGLGMGLYACRKIIALHDGVIGVRSVVGRGTTFRISFDAI
jgi:signal transduction histidine kinase